MTLTLPDQFLELFEGMDHAEAEARVRLAAQFYASGEVSVGKGAELAGLKRWEFEQWLHRHHVHIPWTVADLAQDLAAAAKLKSQH
jgi:predicted HTH domain antitoxin